MTAAEVILALKKLASPEKAKASAWYFKTAPGEYGAGDRFIGVTVPEQRKVAKQFRNLPLSEVEKLLQSPIHEYRLTALFILVGQYQKGSREYEKFLDSTRRVESRKVVECYLRNLDRVNNWDLVDSSAPYILGDWLMNAGLSSSTGRSTGSGIHAPGFPMSIPPSADRLENDKQKTGYTQTGKPVISLPSLAKSKNVWHRRIAMLTCGGFIRVGQFDDALKIAEILVHDSHDLIQKAVGWMLREIGERDRSAELPFLDRYAATMPRTMLRYAIEKFSATDRQHYLHLSGRTRGVEPGKRHS